MIYGEELLKGLKEIEEIRKKKVESLNIGLERICKMPEEEKIKYMEKMRIMLKLKELYESFEVKVIDDKLAFYNGKPILNASQLKEMDNILEKCSKQELEYYNLVHNEELVVDDDIREEITDIITTREDVLKTYIYDVMNVAGPVVNLRSAYLINNEDYLLMVKKISELNLSIKDDKLYLDDKQIKTRGEFIEIRIKMNEICKIADKIVKAE